MKTKKPLSVTMLLAFIVLTGLPASAQPVLLAPISAELADRLESSGPAETAVVFVHGTDIAAAEAATRAAGMRLVDTFDGVGVTVASGSLANVSALRSHPGISLIEEADTEVELLGDTSHVATRSRDVIDGLTVRAEGSGTPRSKTVGPYDGTGVSIAIIDTGIDAGLPFFQTAGGSKVVRNLVVGCIDKETLKDDFGAPLEVGTCARDNGLGNDPVFDVPGTTDFHGHGTHVAGIAAGVEVSFEGRRLHGAAPGASLVGLSVGIGHAWAPAAALNWVLENHETPCGDPSTQCPPIRVINNSWGWYGEQDPEHAITKLVNALIGEGVTVVWGAGNEKGDGSESRTNRFSPPTPGSITVAAYDDETTGRRDLDLTFFSSKGKIGSPETYPDISAPGYRILSACARGAGWANSFQVGPGPEPGDIAYCEQSGTSMSSPHVAGIVAQLLQADPSLTPAEIDAILKETADLFGSAQGWERDTSYPWLLTSYDRGYGLVDAAAAVATALRAPEPTDPQPALVEADPQGRIDATSPTYSFVGAVGMSPFSDQAYGCDGVPEKVADLGYTRSTCHFEYVEVEVPPSGTTLRVEISSADLLPDHDLYLRDPYGSSLGASLFSNDDVVTAWVEKAGIYTVFVKGYSGPLDTAFTGEVTLETGPRQQRS